MVKRVLSTYTTFHLPEANYAKCFSKCYVLWPVTHMNLN